VVPTPLLLPAVAVLELEPEPPVVPVLEPELPLELALAPLVPWLLPLLPALALVVPLVPPSEAGVLLPQAAKEIATTADGRILFICLLLRCER
jgi:hypothetical protein